MEYLVMYVVVPGCLGISIGINIILSYYLMKEFRRN